MSAYQIKTNQNEPVSPKTLATAVAALQRLNYRVKMLDPCARSAMFVAKLKISELLCRRGFCAEREIQHRDFRESICRMRFRLGCQSFIWAVPTNKIHFDVSIKDTPALYDGDPADDAKIAVMSDQELLIAATNTNVEIQPAAPSDVQSFQDPDEQQLNWLSEFYSANGKWPSCNDVYPAGNDIGKKVYIWREYYKRGTLCWRIVQRLNELKFPWDGSSNDWFGSYFKLYNYLLANSHWPSKSQEPCSDELSMANWMKLQRNMYKSGVLSPRKKWLLDRLNFDWGGYSKRLEKYKRLH
jgi:hypothetical protein